ncbi:CBS domain-containing protein [Paenibacillus sp.]|uniref:CBS domain-containing protein n=1 Tax=Paenibacillus sp. TaxID=58172 RepID=UPI002D73188A|nr:CBS domain-containing protein [Paenibacillus sp.]HZG54949.1 CBS domain-containing protein [Paenibacillus sp.]
MNANGTVKTVRDIMQTDIVTVTLKDNIYEIALKMKQHDIGFIPVVEGKQLLGVVTDRDLVVRGYAEKHSGSTAVKEVMSDQQVVSVPPTTPVDEAARLMAKNQIRRLPIVENNELVGVVAIGDLAVRSKLEEEAGHALSEISEKHKQSIGHN